MSGAAAALAAAREALAGSDAWVVGGAVRDELLGRATDDLDLAVAGEPRQAARAVARAAGGSSFELSGAFGTWRAVGPGHAWHVDVVALRDGDLHADLAERDFTVNAMARPLAGGDLVDPHGGAADLDRRVLRVVAATALAADPLRTLRAVRLATELGLSLAPETAEGVRAQAPRLAEVAPERVFAELKRVVVAPAVRAGLELAAALGVTAVVLPELEATRGIEQNVYHHADVHDHTLEVLDGVVAIEADPAAALDPPAPDDATTTAVRALLAEPLADELTRGGALRLAALLHDAAKPQTRGERPDGRVTFLGHDAAGADLARAVLGRLRASRRLTAHVAALVEHHLTVGFLVHQRPLDRRAIWRYLRATAPVAADEVLLTVADRRATRGRKSGPAIAAHLEVARPLLAAALQEHGQGVPVPLVRGDDLVAALGVERGPRLGTLLAQLAEDQFAGAVATREQALARARDLL